MPLFRRRDVPIDRSLGDPRAAAMLAAAESRDLDGMIAAFGQAETPEERERLTSLLSTVSERADMFDAWAQREPDRADAWLVRGAHGVGWAWEARGTGHAEHVGDQAFEVFFERLRRAEDSLLRAAEMAPEDPIAWSHLIISGRGLQVPKEELHLRYDESKSRRPWMLEGNLQMLQGLCDKWSGSDVDSLQFAGGVAREAPDGSPVLALVPMAHIEIWLALHWRERGNPRGYISGPEVREEIMAVAERSVLSDDFEIDLVSAPAMNIFAFALWAMGEDATAAGLVQRLGTRRTEFPWAYADDPGKVYGKLLG